VSTYEQSNGEPLRPELRAVADAAGARLRAEVDEDNDGMDSASDRLREAATVGMAAGCSLTEIAGAEARGQNEVRQELRGGALDHVEQSGHRARQAEAEHHAAVARAVRLGLSTRAIAAAAHVTHGTVRTINIRYADAHQASTDQAVPKVGEDWPPADGDVGEEQRPEQDGW
jgi:hypothetical protein